MELISKNIIISELEKLHKDAQIGKQKYSEDNDYPAYMECVHNEELIEKILWIINGLAVKEVNLDSEIKNWLGNGDITDIRYDDYDDIDIERTAKHFFELGLQVNNHMTGADKGTAEEIMFNLKRVEKDYCINLSKEIEWLKNQVKKRTV